ncbi:MAG: hypothetical protein R2764_05595 [Bacteroidales bacterium]
MIFLIKGILFGIEKAFRIFVTEEEKHTTQNNIYMKSKKFTTIILFLLFAGLNLVYFGCKKIDLVKIAYVKTGTPTNILSTTATAHGELIDLGEGEASDHGFCWSLNPNPTISSTHYSFGKANSTGDFTTVITNLVPSTDYYLRSYIEDNNGVAYGNTTTFKTLNSGGSSSYWLSYDGVPEENGVGLTDGGSFDVAIRLPSQALQQYIGYKVTRVKFIPRTGYPVTYSITLWEGTNPPSLMHVQNVVNPTIGDWNEVYLVDLYEIQANAELWVGYWVQNQPPGEFPAGVDAGPAIEGAGNMISFDDGDSWDALSILNPDLDFNWNLKVYVTNGKGEEVILVNNLLGQRDKSYLSPGKTINTEVQSQKSINNN